MYRILIVLILSAGVATGQKKTPADPATVVSGSGIYNGMQWRNVGPFRGGRSAAVTGVPGKPNLFYFGATGGGVWRTTDAGNSWENISDGFFGGSVGSIAVSEWDPNVIYVGGGEVTVRGNVSYGYGIWKTDDAGKTWKSVGLKESRHIPRIVLDPKNPEVVYAAVLGDLFKSNTERGIYKSVDGGKTWIKKLFANEDAGVVELVMDPNNSRILYASTWRVRRTPFSLESGGAGSGLWKSVDAGETWKEITTNSGLPKGVWGISGITVSRVNSNRLYAIVENENGGVFTSTDAGATWKKVNDNRSLRQRAWYYSKIYADTKEEETVYVLNVDYHRSKDGGKTFESFEAPHGDHHDLWIAPEDNQRMIIADDGGAQVSFDAGSNWSTYHNQPTAQFYRVTTDNHFPYRIYGAQQDNSTVRIAHRTSGSSIEVSDYEETAGGESGHIAVDPLNNDIVYGGSYDGYLTRYNHKTGEEQNINPWPDNPMGHGAEGAKYRFQWNFPIFFSPHDPKKLYAASQSLHVSTDGGQSWSLISGDLTRNDPSKLGPSGGPITKDNTSVEYYCTIFAAGESPYEKDFLITGSDDGLVHITRDGGKSWVKSTVGDLPEWSMINSVEFDPFVKGGAYIAATRYKLGDYRPYLYKTKDYGKTWSKITNGIDAGHFTRVVRADPKRAGLLYAGTESGMYISFDDGNSWNPFQLNLPIVPITDLTVKNNNLIAATQGRAFWMIDDLTVLHQINPTISNAPVHLFKPMPGYRMRGSASATPSKTAGMNHPGGVTFYYYIKDTANVKFTFEIKEPNGTLIRKYALKADRKAGILETKIKPGLNKLNWNLRYSEAEGFDGIIMWAAGLGGPTAVPGTYKAILKVNEVSYETEFEVLKDPRSTGTVDDIKAQFDFQMKVREKLSETHKAIKKIRSVRDQINRATDTYKDKNAAKEILELAKEINGDLKKIEEALYQTKNKSGQDPLNYPIRLNNKLAALSSEAGGGDFRPTAQVLAVYDEVVQKIDLQLVALENVFKEKLPKLNGLIKASQPDPINTEN